MSNAHKLKKPRKEYATARPAGEGARFGEGEGVLDGERRGAPLRESVLEREGEGVGEGDTGSVRVWVGVGEQVAVALGEPEGVGVAGGEPEGLGEVEGVWVGDGDGVRVREEVGLTVWARAE